jgi:hypothetical protein
VTAPSDGQEKRIDSYLRKAERCFGQGLVVAVDKHAQVAAVSRLSCRLAHKFILVQWSAMRDDEAVRRIMLATLRPLNRSRLMVRRDRDD